MTDHSVFTRRAGLVLLSAVLSWTSVQAGDGYRELRNEMDHYAPPGYVWGSQKISPDISQTRPRQEETAAILREKSRFEALLSENVSKGGFLDEDSPIAALTSHLSSAAEDDRAALAILSGGFSIETLAALALIRSPEIHGAVRRFRAELENFTQVADLEAVLSRYSAFTESLMTGIGSTTGDTADMRFPAPGVTALKGQAAGQSAAAARENVEIARRETVTALRKAFWDLWFVREAETLTRETAVRLRELETVADARYRTGKAGFQEAVSAAIREKITSLEVKTLAEERRNTEVMILSALNLPPSGKVGIPKAGELDAKIPRLDPLYPLARERRQELRRMRAEIGRMERMIEMGETMTLPSFSLGLSVFEDRAMSRAGSSAMTTFFGGIPRASSGAGLPLRPWAGVGSAWLGQTRQAAAALKLELVKAEAETDARVRTAWFGLDRAVREIAVYREVAGLSRQVLEVAVRGFESGAVSFGELIEARTRKLDADLTLSRKRRDAGAAWAELHRSVGVTF